jgi:hypothetical protein
VHPINPATGQLMSEEIEKDFLESHNLPSATLESSPPGAVHTTTMTPRCLWPWA